MRSLATHARLIKEFPSEDLSRRVFLFGGNAPIQPQGLDKTVTGGKGANLSEMSSIGLPVPPGFTISTEECLEYLKSRTFSATLDQEVASALKHVEAVVGKRFGNAANPLLVSVRSGARVSMPGMMDTVLNLGLNDATVEGLAATSGDQRFAWDSYRRFIQMYANVVLGVPSTHFEDALEAVKQKRAYRSDSQMAGPDWKHLADEYKEIVEIEHGGPFPQDVNLQLSTAISAVFDSWESDRAKVYRRLNDIPGDWGTAVTVQAMVFGNMGEGSATGVGFTRNPATGERALYGEWLPNAQGEDVVAGIRTPQFLTKSAREAGNSDAPSMEEALPETFAELACIFGHLERHYRDMQDVEFTVERGALWILQTRSGKRTARAAVKLAVDMVEEGLIDQKTAVLRVDPGGLDQFLHPALDPEAQREVLATGLPASPGAASGRIVLDADTATNWAARGERVLLVRTETSPEDIHGMHAAAGILTARGGMTSHAAVVARGMGRPCIAGASAIVIDVRGRGVRIGERQFAEGDEITIDGATGEIMGGALATVEPEMTDDFKTLMAWADRHRRMKVRANAETAVDCQAARRFGAEGIGLCRTEHMFFERERLAAVREMILASDEVGRRAALNKLLPAQRGDFVEVFTEMAGLPVTIRLLDPPLHEFLPVEDSEFNDLALTTGFAIDVLKARAAALRETNPMLGHRGCRLGIAFPEIYEMQARAIFEAATEVARTSGQAARLEIMIPLVATGRELQILRELVERVASEVAAQSGREIGYLLGTMIELPRAALMAGEIAREAEFFSFGTNDLTQTTLGLSRDDAGTFLPAYVDAGIYPRDPFVSLDVEGTGQLLSLAAERGRSSRPDLKLGICGEHAGDPASIAFCEELGLDYVSASPFRVPLARLAAAQATLRRDELLKPN